MEHIKSVKVITMGEHAHVFQPIMTLPEVNVVYHMIADHELDNIMTSMHQPTLALASSCFGYVLGQLQFIGNLALTFLHSSHYGGGTVMSVVDVINVVVVAIAGALCIVFATQHLRAKPLASQTLEKIRSRKSICLDAYEKGEQ